MKRLALIFLIMVIGTFAIYSDASLTAGIGLDLSSYENPNAIAIISPHNSMGMYAKIAMDLGFDLSRTSITVGPATHKQFGILGLLFGGGLNFSVLPQSQYNSTTFSGIVDGLFTRMGFSYDLVANFSLNSLLSIVAALEAKATMALDTTLNWNLSPYAGISLNL